MRRIKQTLTLAIAALAVAGCTATGDSWNREVEIVNRTDFSILTFHGSNVGTDDWEEDILGDSVIPPHRSVIIDFDDGTGYCHFDFRAEFSDGDVVVKNNVDVCSVTSVTYE